MAIRGASQSLPNIGSGSRNPYEYVLTGCLIETFAGMMRSMIIVRLCMVIG
jgi:hypothetical protein